MKAYKGLKSAQQDQQFLKDFLNLKDEWDQMVSCLFFHLFLESWCLSRWGWGSTACSRSSQEKTSSQVSSSSSPTATSKTDGAKFEKTWIWSARSSRFLPCAGKRVPKSSGNKSFTIKQATSRKTRCSTIHAESEIRFHSPLPQPRRSLQEASLIEVKSVGW